MLELLKEWTAWLEGLPGGELLPLLLAGAGLVVGGLGIALGLVRFTTRRWAQGARDWRLARSKGGRKVLGRAREIRGGTRRVLRALARAGGDRNEARALRTLLERFVARDLPDTVERAFSFVATGGERPARRLREALVRQQRQWNEAPDGAGRDRMAREIAATRHLLAQREEANRNLARLLEGLNDATMALRLLEIELASLEAERSPALRELRDQLAETAEGLRHQREAHRSLGGER